MKVCSFRKLTLSAAAALVAISLSPGSAQADCAPGTPAGTCRVTVRGLQYDVTTFSGASDNVIKFAPPPAPGAMPWWGDSVLAGEFATAVGKGLNFKPPGTVELTPAFAYQHVESTLAPSLCGEGILLFVQYSNSTGKLSRGGAGGLTRNLRNLRLCGPEQQYKVERREKSIFWPQATLVPIP